MKSWRAVNSLPKSTLASQRQLTFGNWKPSYWPSFVDWTSSEVASAEDRCSHKRGAITPRLPAATNVTESCGPPKCNVEPTATVRGLQLIVNLAHLGQPSRGSL